MNKVKCFTSLALILPSVLLSRCKEIHSENDRAIAERSQAEERRAAAAREQQAAQAAREKQIADDHAMAVRLQAEENAR